MSCDQCWLYDYCANYFLCWIIIIFIYGVRNYLAEWLDGLDEVAKQKRQKIVVCLRSAGAFNYSTL